MKRARYLVFFELIFVGFLCLTTFLFAIFVWQSGGDELGWAVPILAIFQIALTVVTLLVTHLTLRTVFRRGAAYEAPMIANSVAFRSVPVVMTALGIFHVLLLQVTTSAVREFGWSLTRDVLIYVFAFALLWHILTAWMLKHAPNEVEVPTQLSE